MKYIFIKRAIDITFSLITLILLMPLFIAILLTIMVTERTYKVFYTSIRIGQFNKPFKMYKFRTMRINCPEMSLFVKTSNDPRITKIGKFLRKTSLDEIPQFLNVLRGDMSIVGNRPVPLKEAQEMAKISLKRFVSPAGITGLWQVNKERANTIQKRIIFDTYYSKNINMKTDLQIMFKTAKKMFYNY